MQRDPAAPPVLDGYTAVRPLGAGGFSDVFLYEQELPRRSVAVKVLSGSITDAMRAGFVREANLMAALSTHPYIVTIHHAGIAGDGRPYLVMEYCSRPSLAERYKAQPLTVADTLRTGIRIAGAVATLHGAGILHRDIKPANVLTNDYGWPALTDFGIATAFGQAALGEGSMAGGTGGGDGGIAGETGSGTIGLSVPWSPPEMFVDDPDPDVRSDVFSLAATLWTVLAGRTPFEVRGGPNGQLDLISRIERGEVTPMTRTDLPVSLQAALARGMAPRREDRWQSALDVARALQRIELELGYAPTGIEVPSAGTAPARPVAAPGGGRDDDEEDATRLRAMPTVIAQPSSALASAPAPSLPARAIDVTPPRAPDAAARGPRGRRFVVGAVVAIVAVVAIAAVVVAILLGGAVRPDAAGASPARTGGSAVGAQVPSPAGGTATVSADGTSVVFAWANPKPADGDVYYWARSETPDQRTMTDQTTATVTGVVPGSRVCIDVAIDRAGRDSAPTRICTP